ncbi:hypothetical protein F1643_21615 [Azospirillum sp. INR13]|uniref:hypothetical protein n=1 Tax=Azospirillum sp. INR13 TaxID=2596919 RepID=UPI00189249FB|nr:hypothetical protein [Azospirillum sp. INR13]MBF5096590.1 hypothetical protein [Azospirillum sp. INR13]
MATVRLMRNGTIIIAEHREPDRIMDATDHLALLGHVRSLPEFEPGLTVAELMRCLRPWAEVLSRMGWCDFDAWDRALAPPHLRLVGDTDGKPTAQDEPPVAEMVITPTITATAERTGQWALDIAWETLGVFAWPRVDDHTGHQDLYCSLSFSPPAEWAHLPIRIEHHAKISNMDFAGTGRRLLTDAVASTKHAPSTIEVFPSFLDAIVLGFLDDISFHGSPEETLEVREEVFELAEGVRNELGVEPNRDPEQHVD